MIVGVLVHKHTQTSLSLFIFLLIICFVGCLDTSQRKLTPIAKMSWLITDSQLAKLHRSYDMYECVDLRTRINVAMAMNISAEIVNNWCEHMRNTYVHEKDSRPSQHYCESNDVYSSLYTSVFVCIYASLHGHVCMWVCICVCVCICVWVFVYVCVCLCVNSYSYTLSLKTNVILISDRLNILYTHFESHQ